MRKNVLSPQFQNSLFLATEHAIIVASTFAFSIFAARVLSLEDFGTLALAQYLFTFCSAFLTLSLNALTLQKLCEDLETADTVLGTAYLTQLASSAVVALTIYFYCLFTNKTQETVTLVIILGLVNILRRADIFQVYWKAKELSIRSAVARVIARAAGILYIIFIYASEAVTVLTAAGYFVVEALIYLICVHLAFYNNGRRLRLKLRLAFQLLSQVKSEIANNFVLSIVLALPMIVLERYSGAEALAPLSLALMFLSVFMNLGNAFCDGFYRKMVKYQESQKLFVASYIRISIIFSLLIVGLNLFIGDSVIQLLFGDKYKAGHDVFILVSVILFVTLPTRILFRLVYMAGLQKYNKYRILPASFLSALASVYFIPNYGVYGAISSLMTYYLVGDFLGYFLSRKLRPIGLEFMGALKIRGGNSCT